MSPEPARAPGGLRPRPLSPHIQIYSWQLTSVLSILHRVTGLALTAGALLLVWWLLAAASGPEAFERVSAVLASVPGRVLLFGWTLAFFYHLANGIRHLWWDTGRGMELPSVYRSGWVVVAFTVAASLAAWAIGYLVRGA
ncbi:MAG: succinate dehydrogenase, cytochrome b556 subunit [Rhodospirillales bacterium]|nr:succinate dehydrogenase, cytochrome b556 subunit [Rhodospirillales bacterium]